MVKDETATRYTTYYRYADRSLVTTYYLKKAENKECTNNPTGHGIAKSAFARIYKIMFYSLLGYGSCFSQIMNGQELENKKNVYSVYLDKKIYIDKNKMEWKTSGTKTF